MRTQAGFSRRILRTARRDWASAAEVTVQVFTTTTRAREGSSVRVIPRETRPASMTAESNWLSLQPRVAT